jgi:hypothetical protein
MTSGGFWCCDVRRAVGKASFRPRRSYRKDAVGDIPRSRARPVSAIRTTGLMLISVFTSVSCAGTSRSTEPAGTWEAGASIFSGRPDPSWEMTRDIANSLVRCLQHLSPASAATPQPPSLGYRGSWFRAPDGREWRLFGGLVEAAPGTGSTRLRDPNRNCERQILKTAPVGVLPPGVI